MVGTTEGARSRGRKQLGQVAMRPMKRRTGLRVATLVAFLFAYGVVGYLLFRYSVVEAVHNTILVLTTVGFTPQHVPNDPERAFTASVAALGVVGVLVGAALFATALVEGRVGVASRRKRMERLVGSLEDHYIICAYGRVGRAVARELEAEAIRFCVIDRQEGLEDVMRADGVPYIVGDPTSETVLRSAGIERARGIISAVDSDAGNVYIVLTARSLNPDVFIVARASETAAADRLYRAGANRVVSPYVSSGRHMASLAARPRVVDYLEIAGPSLRLEELAIDAGSPLAGARLEDACGAATALVVRHANGEVVAPPHADLILTAGDLVVLMGEPIDLRSAEGRRD